ncbi:C-C motif chemokine 1 isoform X1 [Ovis canadensis]|uniref:C-C motif chemokine 1 isoform X1 n=1 Tax=Ovis canadensis TaxID=37174 RepID=UPI00375200ED
MAPNLTNNSKRLGQLLLGLSRSLSAPALGELFLYLSHLPGELEKGIFHVVTGHSLRPLQRGLSRTTRDEAHHPRTGVPAAGRDVVTGCGHQEQTVKRKISPKKIRCYKHISSTCSHENHLILKLTGGLEACVFQKDSWVQAYLKRINPCLGKEMKCKMEVVKDAAVSPLAAQTAERKMDHQSAGSRPRK